MHTNKIPHHPRVGLIHHEVPLARKQNYSSLPVSKASSCPLHHHHPASWVESFVQYGKAERPQFVLSSVGNKLWERNWQGKGELREDYVSQPGLLDNIRN
jgi:hypothetical protein